MVLRCHLLKGESSKCARSLTGLRPLGRQLRCRSKVNSAMTAQPKPDDRCTAANASDNWRSARFGRGTGTMACLRTPVMRQARGGWGNMQPQELCRPNGVAVKLRGQGPHAEADAAHGVHACESRDAGRAPPSRFDFTRRLGRRAEAGPRQLLRRVRRPEGLDLLRFVAATVATCLSELETRGVFTE